MQETPRPPIRMCHRCKHTISSGQVFDSVSTKQGVRCYHVPGGDCNVRLFNPIGVSGKTLPLHEGV